MELIFPRTPELVICKDISNTVSETSGVGQPVYPPGYNFANDLQDCRVYILDVSRELPKSAGLPSCDPNNVAVWPFSQWWWSVDGYGSPVEHYHRQHAAPYYITKAIGESRYAVKDMEEADVVIVNDYCYWTW